MAAILLVDPDRRRIVGFAQIKSARDQLRLGRLPHRTPTVVVQLPTEEDRRLRLVLNDKRRRGHRMPPWLDQRKP